MATVKATFTIRNDRREEYNGDDGDPTGHDRGHDTVEVGEKRRREITATRELTGVEDAVWAIESQEYEVVWDLWEHIDGDDFAEWGFRSPYPNGDVRVSFDHTLTLHDVVWHIAQREDAEPPGVYLDLIHNSRIYGDEVEMRFSSRVRGLARYLEAMGVDTSYWTHGRDGLTNMDAKKLPDEMLEHAGYEPE